MGDERRVSRVAVVLVVLLRLGIGWQLLYEGLWKFHSLNTPKPWTAEGYLKNAQGPFRETFRNLTGDPDELGWLDYDRVLARWNDWYNRFTSFHSDLSDRQKVDLYNFLYGPQEFAAKLDQLPKGVTVSDKGNIKFAAVKYDPKGKRLVVDGKLHLLPDEREGLLALVKDDDSSAAKQFQRAVQEVFQRSLKLSQSEKLAVLLKADPARVGLLSTTKGGEVVERRMGEIENYKELLKRYNAGLARAKTAFQWDHLNTQWTEIQKKRQELVGPVKKLDEELRRYAEELLTTEQLGRGPVPEALTPVDKINRQTMWGLTILGVLLIAGLFTPVAAIGGAVMVFFFYLAVPPWPGVPEVPGPEHSFIINKNLIEVMALLAIAALPTGRWFGMDALLYRFWPRRKPKTP